MDINFIINGLIAGFIATGAMSILQVPMYRKWGMTSVLEFALCNTIFLKFEIVQPNSGNFKKICKKN